MSFRDFGKFELEEKIGTQLLERLANILPYLDKNVSIENIYHTKNLSKIFIAFSDSKIFENLEFRKKYLFLESNEKINMLCDKLNIDNNQSLIDKVNQLCKFKWSNIDYAKVFIEIFDLPDNFLPSSKITYSNLEYVHGPENIFKTLKDYQTPVYYESIKRLMNRNTRFIIQMPTGSGKTRTSMEIISDVFINNDPGKVVVWLVNSEELCEQAVETFQQVWTHVGNKEIDLIRVWGSNDLIIPEENRSAFIVGGFQKLLSIYKKNQSKFDLLRERAYLVVVDEAHRVLATTYKNITEAIFGKNSRLIGLTATPGRSIDNFVENKELFDFFPESKVEILTPNGEPVIKYLKDSQILSYTIFQSLQTSPSYNLAESDKRYIEGKYDFPPGFIKKLGDDDTRNLEIMSELINNLKEYKKILFFACSVEHSKYICSILSFLGFQSAHIDGSTERGARQNILKHFRFGTLQIICNFGILSTGFDAPLTDLVFIARPTRSIVLYSQMIGRGLRGPKIGGTDKCKIITVKDNINGLPQEDDIYSYFDEYFDLKID